MSIDPTAYVQFCSAGCGRRVNGLKIDNSDGRCGTCFSRGIPVGKATPMKPAIAPPPIKKPEAPGFKCQRCNTIRPMLVKCMQCDLETCYVCVRPHLEEKHSGKPQESKPEVPQHAVPGNGSTTTFEIKKFTEGTPIVRNGQMYCPRSGCFNKLRSDNSKGICTKCAMGKTTHLISTAGLGAHQEEIVPSKPESKPTSEESWQTSRIPQHLTLRIEITFGPAALEVLNNLLATVRSLAKS